MDRLLNLDRRIIFVVLAVAVIVATLWPFEQSFQPSKLVRSVFDKIEQLPARSAVMIVTDFDPQAKAELEPMTLALLRHCFQKDQRVIGLTFSQEGAPFGQALFEQAAQEFPLYFTPRDIKNPAALANRIRQAADPLSDYLKRRLPLATRKMLHGARSRADKQEALAERLASGLNALLKFKNLYAPPRFQQTRLTSDTLKALGLDPKSAPHSGSAVRQAILGLDDLALMRINRRLLADAFPDLLAPLRADGEKKSGVDYVYLGFKPVSAAALITNLGENITSAFSTDASGQPTAGMPALDGVPTLREVALIIDITAGSSVESWIVYGGDKYRVPTAGGCTAVVAPDLYPFVHSGQLIGLIGGLRGAADYETLLNEPLQAVRGMAAQSMSHSVIVAFVIFGNVLFFLSRRRKGRSA